ncbi:MAG: class I SAM-dependent rRNA methyltransferase [Bacteroidales bacterium]|nr:class I SAM-dependent rRNA methyltransferase [Candidatus Colimorpha merdihippi]
MNRPSLILAPGKDKAVLRRHPWIFSGAVRKCIGNPQEGDIVDVFSADGHWMAAGHYQDETIICKVLSFDTPDVDPVSHPEFWRNRIHQAVEYRRRMGLLDSPHTNVFRMVHAEGDFMPGLVADYYNGALVLQCHSVGMHRTLDLIAQLFTQELPLQAIFDKSSATLPGGGATDGYIFGSDRPEWDICEDGNKMMINFFEGQKTGFFVDQRENRHLVSTLSQGRRVLNCFGYTGGFSLGALRGGASYVETVDISKKAIDLCNRNVQLNFGSDAPHKGVVADVLQYLDTVSDQFDVIILDPPAFAKSHRHLQQGLKGYRNINQKAMEKIRPGGILLTFSCSQAVSRDDFQTMCFTAAANAHRQVRIVRQLPHAIDHPVSIYHPEGEYLKGLMLYVE